MPFARPLKFEFFLRYVFFFYMLRVLYLYHITRNQETKLQLKKKKKNSSQFGKVLELICVCPPPIERKIERRGMFIFFFSSKMFHALLFIVTINFIFTKRFEWPSTKTTRKILKGTLSDLILVLLHTHVYYHFLLGFSFRHVLLSDQNPPLSTGFLSNT